ncbi:MAG: DUF5666 domain-containing protein [Armatimonadota bacterium]|nr:DUF5666 domain-containing protein [Armatimonadota bacterium]MDR7475724.1 DUF5666 domain-containing protein [Armatimonadota bacterium]MDR7537911.1 DUF5666 domain-containing protein [Armatimonadota bacterium]
MKWAAVLLIAVFVVTIPTSAWANGRFRGKVEIEGVVISTAPGARFVVIRDQKGRTWVVPVDLVTEIEFEDDDDDERFAHATTHELQVGDEVEIKGLITADGRILALKIEVERERPKFRRPVGIFIRGVIIVVGDGLLTVVTQNGTITVVVHANTRILEGDRRISLRSLGRHDIVVARGNWSGTRLSADEVKVEFDATDGVTLNGLVGAIWARGEAFMIGGTWINVTSRTLIIRDGSPATLGAIRPGGRVAVYGLGNGAAMQALVILIR